MNLLNIVKPFVVMYEEENKDGDGDVKTFSQEQVDKIVQTRLGKERDKTKGEMTKLQSQLKDMNLTKTERDTLNTQVEEMNASLRSKDEQLEHERTTSASKHKKDIDTLTTDRDKWKNDFTDETIKRDLLDGAIANDAFTPGQVVDMLQPYTKLVEELDDDGKKTGKLVRRTTMTLPDLENEGKMETVTLPPAEMIKRMKEKHSDLHGNLFKNKESGGLGGRSNRTQVKEDDMAKLARTDQKAYRELRNKRRGKKFN